MGAHDEGLADACRCHLHVAECWILDLQRDDESARIRGGVSRSRHARMHRDCRGSCATDNGKARMMKTNTQAAAQCIVNAEDYRVYWDGELPAPEHQQTPAYGGPDRRQIAHDRRWLATSGGRRRFDRKS